MANWFCSVFNVVCRKRRSSPHCRSELIYSAWVVIVPGQKCLKKRKEKRNNMSINVYGVDDDKKVIYPLRVSSALVPYRPAICYCLNVMVFSTIPLFETLAD